LQDIAGCNLVELLFAAKPNCWDMSFDNIKLSVKNNLDDVPQLHCKQTLWSQIYPLLKEIEVDFIRREIGEQQTQENEDLFLELSTLVEILLEYREKTERKLQSVPISFQRNKAFQFGIQKSQIAELVDTLQKRGKEVGKTEKEKEICKHSMRWLADFFISEFHVQTINTAS
jgi:hypothetical protein